MKTFSPSSNKCVSSTELLRAAASILSNVRERRQEAKNVREKLESDRERERSLHSQIDKKSKGLAEKHMNVHTHVSGR